MVLSRIEAISGDSLFSFRDRENMVCLEGD
jgi:hypothetical protein